MKCTQCGYDIPPEAKFCPECGAPLKTATSQPVNLKRPHVRDTFILVGALVVVTIGYFVFTSSKKAPSHPAQQPRTNQPVNSMDDAMSMLENLPEDYSSLVAMGNSLMDEGNYSFAAECYKRALSISDTSWNVRVDYGTCLHGMGLSERAVQILSEVVKNQPTHAIAHFNLGVIYYDLNRIDSARLYWQKYLKLDPQGHAAEAAKSLLKETAQ